MPFQVRASSAAAVPEATRPAKTASAKTERFVQTYFVERTGELLMKLTSGSNGLVFCLTGQGPSLQSLVTQPGGVCVKAGMLKIQCDSSITRHEKLRFVPRLTPPALGSFAVP